MNQKLRFILIAIVFTLLPLAFYFLNNFAFGLYVIGPGVYISMFFRMLVFPLSFCILIYVLITSARKLRKKHTRFILFVSLFFFLVGVLTNYFVLDILSTNETIQHVLPYAWSTPWMWIVVLETTLFSHIKKK